MECQIPLQEEADPPLCPECADKATQTILLGCLAPFQLLWLFVVQTLPWLGITGGWALAIYAIEALFSGLILGSGWRGGHRARIVLGALGLAQAAGNTITTVIRTAGG